jgi:hypothetical protein
MRRFVVYSLIEYHVFQFDRPHDVAVFMIGKDPSRYHVYARIDGLPDESVAIEKRLDMVVS